MLRREKGTLRAPLPRRSPPGRRSASMSPGRAARRVHLGAAADRILRQRVPQPPDERAVRRAEVLDEPAVAVGRQPRVPPGSRRCRRSRSPARPCRTCGVRSATRAPAAARRAAGPATAARRALPGWRTSRGRCGGRLVAVLAVGEQDRVLLPDLAAHAVEEGQRQPEPGPDRRAAVGLQPARSISISAWSA